MKTLLENLVRTSNSRWLAFLAALSRTPFGREWWFEISLFPLLLGLRFVLGEQTAADVQILFAYALLALALNVVVGFTGLLHLGIAAFFGVGAYVFAILRVADQPFHFGFPAAVVCATAGTALLGVVLGAPTLRLRGDYLALVTLGFGEVVRYVLRNLEQVTNGTRGLGPLPLGPSPYFVNLACLVLVFVFLRRLEFARLGRAWVALREDELATTCMGISATKVKLSAFGLGAAIAGLGGALYASALGSTANPDAYDFSRSAITLCCVILGGLGSLRGALLGTFLLLGFDTMGTSFLKQHVFDVTDYRLGLFGLALILVMRFRPEGLFPSRRVRAELHEAEAA